VAPNLSKKVGIVPLIAKKLKSFA